MAEKLVKLYYIGTRYMPELKHPRFGKFQLHDDGYFEVPREYADRICFLLKHQQRKKAYFPVLNIPICLMVNFRIMHKQEV